MEIQQKPTQLVRSTELNSEQFLKLIQNEELVVQEDIQGAKLWISYNKSKMDWEIRPKSTTGHVLNMVDYATQKYYKWAYAYLLCLPAEVTDLLRNGYKFCFEYFPEEEQVQPANIIYDRRPKNGLILTCICKYNRYYCYDIEELNAYAKLFDVETLPIIYKGKLSEKQLKAITYYLHTAPADLDFLYKEISFAKFFYTLLNPQLKSSYLRDADFNTNLEKIILRFLKSDVEITMEILNPMYQKVEHRAESEFSDVYSVILFNFVQWTLTQDIDSMETTGTSRDMLYINMISKMFNAWVDKNEKGIMDFKFSVPQFFNQDKFKINQDLIYNKSTLDLINKHSKLEYCFKIILSSFQAERKKPIGIINDQALVHLNAQVRKVQLRIEELLNWNNKLSAFAYKQKDLTKFPNIKWEETDKGTVQFPNMTGVLEPEEDKKKKIKHAFKK